MALSHEQIKSRLEDMEGAEITSATLSDDGCSLTLQLSAGYPTGRFAVQIGVGMRYELPIDPTPVLKIDDDEPAGAGADPYGRPDPQEHPEAWTE